MPKKKSNFQGMPPNQQLIDSLTSHISLYTSKQNLSSSSNPTASPRSSILRWFSSLTPPQRQSHLAAVDPSFVRILLQMLSRIASRGLGTFIILPDLPSPSDSLPSLCFRQSRGLLSRAAESDPHERFIFDSTRLFSSAEGNDAKECSVSVNCLDSITVLEELVRDFDSFVRTMDGVSSGEFLRGEIGELGEDWVELGWLKAKGYYSISAFVANRLEVALRLAWLNVNGGKKRGVKLKEKIAMASVSANLFWRKNGCIHWWQNLDSELRRKAMTAVFGKSAKSLILEILNEANNASEDMCWAFSGGSGHSLKYDQNASSTIQKKKKQDAEFGLAISKNFSPQKSIAYNFNRLFVLQNVITVIQACSKDNLNPELQYFSSLGSLGTLTDCILRKFRGFLMVMYLDYTKHELLEERNCSSFSNKVKENSGSSARRKKGKSHNTKRVNSIASSCQNTARSSSEKSSEEHKRTSSRSDIMLMESLKMKGQKNEGEAPSSAVEMGTVGGSVSRKLLDSAKKNKKGKRKNRNSAKEVKDFEDSSIRAVPFSGISQDVPVELGPELDELRQPAQKDDESGKSVVPLTSSPGHFRENSATACTTGDIIFGNIHVSSCIKSECSEPDNANPENGTLSCLESLCKSTSKEVTPCHGSPDIDTVLNNGETDVQKLKYISRNDLRSVHPNKKGKISEIESGMAKGQERGSFGDQIVQDSSYACQSQEWPSVVSNSLSPNSHLPPATDRLHLDVGRNWQNHLRQPFMPTIHQARNSSVENGCKPILARPLPMSLDWPPVVRGSCSPASSVSCSYDWFIPRRQAPYHQGFSPHTLHLNVASNIEEKYSGDSLEKSDLMNAHDLVDEFDGQWISEEEIEVHGVPGLDYNQYFGGGVMYWNPSDHTGTGFSRPPSLSSDDSFWTWQEADMNRAVDEMVAFSSSYSTNGLASPTAASFCSPFDPLSSGHQALGYVMTGSEVPGLTDSAGEEEGSGSLVSMTADVDGKVGDTLPYPVLRPIIIPNISRERSKRNHELKSPCIPPSRREKPRIKRPPSPVVLCVPRAPRPPPPSPVGDARKHRGFPTVRSGSSSPRHWSVRGWHHDNVNFNLEEGCARMDGVEVVWPSWRKNNLSTHSIIQPLPGSLIQDRLIAISQLARDQEHPDVALPLQPPEPQNCPTRKASLTLLHSTLHDEIDLFWKKVVSENLSRKPYINWAVKRVTRSLQVLWPRSRTNIFGSNATGLSLPTSDVDLVVCLPPVRNLEPIKEAGILEGRNGIKETCLQHAARYLANQEWVKNDSLKTVENTAIPIIMLEVEVPPDLITSASRVQSPKEDPALIIGEDGDLVDFQVGRSEDSITPGICRTNCEYKKDLQTVRLDISFKSASHTGLQTTQLVLELIEQFPAATPLALLLKQFLADRSLDQSYSGGLSSYCLVLLITRFLQHEHHLGRSSNQNFGSLLMDFLYFFGNVFDPRQMRVSVRGSGLYMTRERGHSIDPIHIDDPLCPTNNVGRNCFRIHQCIKAFSEAYSLLEQEHSCLSDKGDASTDSRTTFELLQKIIPGIG